MYVWYVCSSSASSNGNAILDTSSDGNQFYLLDIVRIYTLPLMKIALHRSAPLTHLISTLEDCRQPDLTWGKSDVWQATGKLFPTWITVLSYHLITHFFKEEQPYDQPDTNTAISAFLKTHSQLFPERSKQKKRQKDIFLSSLSQLCLLRSDIAQDVFPLIILSAVAVVAAVSENAKYFSDKLSAYVLCPSCPLSRATILGCKSLHFLLRQSIKTFVKDAPSYKKSGQPNPVPALTPWVLPYSFTLSIDFKMAAEAAIRCKAVCTALLFAEMSTENADKRKLLDYNTDISRYIHTYIDTYISHYFLLLSTGVS